ncbi:hypothetical protein [Streptomyces sp. NPDC090036]|uniref:hypothetical protein n=1 Tax=Streptomyces sp. NPDC090036 TaxID=3365926 RepID=UPI0037F67873
MAHRARVLLAAALLCAALTGCTAAAGPAPAPPSAAPPSVVPTIAPPVAATAAPMPASEPVRVTIPAAGVDTSPVLKLGLAADGTVEVPSAAEADRIGWYTKGLYADLVG